MQLINKIQQRNYYKNLRKKMNVFEKQTKEKCIFNNLINSNIVKDYDLFLAYVSNDFEIDTINIINYLLESKKSVAVPRCIKGSNDMRFFYINSFNDLEEGSFGILEPNRNTTAVNESYFEELVCLVPAICYDKQGYRIGFGKGYYDKFLSKNKVLKVGLCFDDFLINNIYVDGFDICVDKIITDKREVNLKTRGRSLDER